jgi:hypothetical protein
VYFSGDFDDVDGFDQEKIAAVGSKTGELYDWTVDSYPESGGHSGLKAFGSSLYVMAGGFPASAYAFDGYTGEQQTWSLGETPNQLTDMEPAGSNLLVSGYFGDNPNVTGLRLLPQADDTPFEDDPTELGDPADYTAPAPPPPNNPPKAVPAATCTVPSIKKLTKSKATAALKAANCAAGKVTKPKKKKKGKTLKVKSQGKKAGTVLPVGTKITFKLGY